MISLKSAWLSDDAEAHSDWCRHDVVGCDDNGPHSLAQKVDKDFLGLEKSVGLPSTRRGIHGFVRFYHQLWDFNGI